MRRKINYYPLSDMAYSYAFTETVDALKEKDFSRLTILDLFELYPTTKYENDLDALNEEAKQMLLAVKGKIKTVKIELNKYFRTLDDEIFKTDVNTVYQGDPLLVHNYFEAFEQFAKNALVSDEAFLSVLKSNFVALYVVLELPRLSAKYGNAIKEYLISIPTGITYFVREYDERQRFQNVRHYYLPKTFTDKEIDDMILKYIDCDEANLNVVNCLKYHKNGDDSYSISPSTKSKINKAYIRLQNKLFDSGVVSSSHYEIRIDEKQEESSIYKKNGELEILSYSGKWISDNIDNKATLLNNLIYIIELVDLNFRFSCLPEENTGCGLLDAFDNRQKYEYGSQSFLRLDNLQNSIFYAYYQYLRSKDVPLESVYEWCVNDYFKDEFQIDGFKISIPSSLDSLNIKCKNIFSEIDKLLKSYMIFRKYRKIESDIFELESLCKYQDLKSLNGDRYVYPKESRELKRITHLLFSDQSMLNYTKKNGSEKNFLKMLQKHKPNFNDYHEYSKKDLNFLRDNGIITISENGDMLISDYRQITVLKEFYFRGFLDLTHLEEHFIQTISYFKEKGWISFDNTLFSKQEADYLNYYLNNSSFTNAFALRNIYEHTGRLNASDKELFLDYMKGLRILGLILIKINDEFCNFSPEKTKEY